ncbi:uncharacterized protein LOC143287164 [Babylonia areolata]|uniref:uncharacterized protein LOC143287164 n=1 Tax=Babylonia areolata TaxID=304850 RepID=UPI003FD53D6F
MWRLTLLLLCAGTLAFTHGRDIVKRDVDDGTDPFTSEEPFSVTDDSFTTEQEETSEQYYTETYQPHVTGEFETTEHEMSTGGPDFTTDMSSCDKVCENGGTLDSYSCTCQCAQPFSGDTCRRNETCRDYADGCHAWTDSCHKRDIREKHCPLTCGVCSQVEETSCRDIIPTCSEKDCGDKKRKSRLCPLTCGVCTSSVSDKATCEDVLPTCSYPGTVEYCYTPVMKHVLCRYTCGGCDDYAECSDTQTDCAVHKSYYCSESYFKYVSCRATCGVCTGQDEMSTDLPPLTSEAPSCDKVCENGGTLDPYSCTCQCAEPFEGDTCRRNGTCRDHVDGCHAWTDSCHKRDIREKYCPLTCGVCSQVEETGCRDIIPTCSEADCSNTKRKTRLCPLTCGACTSPISDKATCEDVLPTCSYPGTVEYCYTPVMKHVLCRHTCGGCDDYAECSDKRSDCAVHESYYCSESHFKYESCRATCGVCTDDSFTTEQVVTSEEYYTEAYQRK